MEDPTPSTPILFLTTRAEDARTKPREIPSQPSTSTLRSFPCEGLSPNPCGASARPPQIRAVLAGEHAIVGFRFNSRLAAVAALRDLVDEIEELHVDNARSLGWSWQAIAEALGITRQSVHKKHHVRRRRRSEQRVRSVRRRHEFHHQRCAGRIAPAATQLARHRARPSCPGRDVLAPEVAAILPDAEAIATALDVALDESSRPDADLLAAVGVDLEAVRSAVRRTFGERALEDLGWRRVRQHRRPWRRPTRRCMSILSGSTTIAPRLKRVFEHAARKADRRKLLAIDPQALLLGLVEVEDAMSSRLLRRAGVDPHVLGQSLRALGG